MSWPASALVLVAAVVLAGWVALNRWRCWERQLLAESRVLAAPENSVLGERGPAGEAVPGSLERACAAVGADLEGGQGVTRGVGRGTSSTGRVESATALASPADCSAPPTAAAPPVEADVAGGRGTPWGWSRWGWAAAGAALAGGAVLAIGERPALLLYVYLAAVLLPLLVCDVRLHRLPTCFIAPAYPATAIAFLFDAAVTGEWTRLLHAVLGCAILGGVYLAFCVAPGALMGLGDVRLAGVLGAALAWISWQTLLVGALGAFFLSFFVAAPLLLLRRTQLHSRVAFGPYMLITSALAVAVGV